MADAIRVEGLVKTYGERTAVRSVSFAVRTGEVLGLLGPNGAGKTTTVEILEGLRARSAGAVEVLGRDPAQGGRWLRNRLGVVLQNAAIDGQLSVTEVVRLYGSFYRRPRPVRELLALVGLSDASRVKVAALSGGQRRRADLALALVGNPEILFLDEPTTGFDPAARRRAWDVIAGLRGLGVTILLTSHYLDEVEHLADRVVVLRAGTVVAEGRPSELRSAASAESTVTFRCFDPAALPAGPWRELASAEPHRRSLVTSRPTEALAVLSRWAIARGIELEELEVRRPSLEDVYLALTGEG